MKLKREHQQEKNINESKSWFLEKIINSSARLFLFNPRGKREKNTNY